MTARERQPLRWLAPKALASNPLAARELRRLFRQRGVTFALLLGFWLPCSWFLRVHWSTSVVGHFTNAPFWVLVVLETLPLVLRPDFLVALWCATVFLPLESLREESEELRRSLLSPGELLAGKAAPPLAIFAAGIALLAPLQYARIFTDPLLAAPLPWLRWPLPVAVTLLAMLEDILFAALSILAIYWQWMKTRDALAAAVRGFLLCALAGAMTGLLSISAAYFGGLIALALDLGPRWDYAFGNALFFSAVLPFQFALLRGLWRGTLAPLAQDDPNVR